MSELINNNNRVFAKVVELREELIKIQNNFIFKPLTKEILEKLDYSYKELFKSFGLEDLQYTLKYREGRQIIDFIPMRPIDEYAIAAILEL